VAEAAEIPEEKVLRRLEAELPRTFSEGFFADVAVLVEGDTEKAILETLSERLDLALDARGIAVLPVGGKEGLRLAAELLEQLGTKTFIVVDGDALGASRKTPAKQAAARKSHKEATEAVLGWMCPGPAVYGKAPTEYGDATAVGANYCFLHDDLEHELEAWPEFKTAREHRGLDLRDKNVSAYRAVAFDAGMSGLPDVFERAIRSMIGRRDA
jgi:putative ATP-dependent endonuclease of OLD family